MPNGCKQNNRHGSDNIHLSEHACIYDRHFMKRGRQFYFRFQATRSIEEALGNKYRQLLLASRSCAISKYYISGHYRRHDNSMKRGSETEPTCFTKSQMLATPFSAAGSFRTSSANEEISAAI